MSIDEPPWPQPGDVAFQGDADWWHNACVGWTSEQWHAYSGGFRNAGDILVDRVMAERHLLDVLVCPICYLYRHAIELHLKQLIIQGSEVLGEPNPRAFGHDLSRLWADCRPIVEKLWPEGSATDLDAVGEVIRQFHDRDPRSTLFRYPLPADEQLSMQDADQINVRNLREVANRLFNFLDGCATVIVDWLGDKRRGSFDAC